MLCHNHNCTACAASAACCACAYLAVSASARLVPCSTCGFLSCSGLDDPITSILASLRPGDVRPVLTAMSQHVPRTLDALLLHALPPAAAELLTQKLEQANAAATETTGNPLTFGWMQPSAR